MRYRERERERERLYDVFTYSGTTRNGDKTGARQLYDDNVFAICYQKSSDRQNIRHGHYRDQTTLKKRLCNI
jgi:hypothetical protein